MTFSRQNIFRFSIIALAILFNMVSASALTCGVISSPTFFALCQQGSCTDGFSIDFEYTGNECETRDVVSDKEHDFEKIFSSASTRLNQELSTGIYKMTFGSLEKISDTGTLEELERIKSGWEIKLEEEQQTIVLIEAIVLLAIVVITALAIFWPWIITKIKPQLKKKLPWMILLAIIIQIVVDSSIGGFSAWSYYSWRWTSTIASQALWVSIMLEIAYLVFKTRLKKKLVLMILLAIIIQILLIAFMSRVFFLEGYYSWGWSSPILSQALWVLIIIEIAYLIFRKLKPKKNPA